MSGLTGFWVRAPVIGDEIAGVDFIADGLKTLQDDETLGKPLIGAFPAQRPHHIGRDFDRQFLGRGQGFFNLGRSHGFESFRQRGRGLGNSIGAAFAGLSPDFAAGGGSGLTKLGTPSLSLSAFRASSVTSRGLPIGRNRGAGLFIGRLQQQ